MAVIPFVIDSSNPTVVSSRQEFEEAGGLDGQALFIQNLDHDQVGTARSDGNVSYDFRVGDEYRDHRDVGKTELLEDDEITLLSGAAVIIETMESVQFPRTRFGHIVPKVSLLQKGISNTASKIDPGYNGRLLITVFNLGRQKVTLKKGQKFCTLYVLSVQSGAIPYRKEAKRIVGAAKANAWFRLRDFVENNSGLLSAVATILSAVLIILEIIRLFVK